MYDQITDPQAMIETIGTDAVRVLVEDAREYENGEWVQGQSVPDLWFFKANGEVVLELHMSLEVYTLAGEWRNLDA